MYSQGFVVSILHKGEICGTLVNGVVPIPFGAEYSIRLRNKNNRRAVAVVFVDNQNVSEEGIVVPANSHVDIHGEVNKHVKFKFVSSNSYEAVQSGKSGATDGSNGVVRVEWRLEKERKLTFSTLSRSASFSPATAMPMSFNASDDSSGGRSREEKTSGGILKNLNLGEGCTVAGSHSSQTWNEIHVDLEDGPPLVIQIVLQGYEQEAQKVSYCSQCSGDIRNKDMKYCPNCGSKIWR